MKKYEYPKEVTDENFQKLVARAKTISRKSSSTLGVAILVSLGLLCLFVFFLAPSLRAINDPSITASVALVISFGLSLFVSVFLIDAVNVFLRRIFNNCVSYYPSPEEFVFAQCILTANLYSEKKRVGATIKAKSLCSELSNFTRYDPLNFRRKFYKNEFRLLTSGKNQIGRMLLFSEAKVKELVSNFALALVNHDDPKAYLYLRHILKEVEKFGKIEGWQKRIESQLKSLKGIIGIIATIVTIAGILWGIFS
jgi:hypothetical protein